jgi:hypothetical protein
MTWANTVIAMTGTILGFATSAVVAEVRHAESAPSYAVISLAQTSTTEEAVALKRYRSISAVASGLSAVEAPKRLPQLALAAGPNGPGERLAR